MNKEFFVMLLASVFIRVYPWFIFLFRFNDETYEFYKKKNRGSESPNDAFLSKASCFAALRDKYLRLSRVFFVLRFTAAKGWRFGALNDLAVDGDFFDVAA